MRSSSRNGPENSILAPSSTLKPLTRTSPANRGSATQRTLIGSHPRLSATLVSDNLDCSVASHCVGRLISETRSKPVRQVSPRCNGAGLAVADEGDGSSQVSPIVGRQRPDRGVRWRLRGWLVDWRQRSHRRTSDRDCQPEEEAALPDPSSLASTLGCHQLHLTRNVPRARASAHERGRLGADDIPARLARETGAQHLGSRVYRPPHATMSGRRYGPVTTTSPSASNGFAPVPRMR